MYVEVKLFTEPEELLSWAAIRHPTFQMNREEAELLLNYMEGHAYAVGAAANGEMVRVSIQEDTESVEAYSLDELIDAVSEWNYEMLQDADTKRRNPANFIEFANEQARYESLLEEEKRLDPLFDQTVYGKHIDRIAKELAGALIDSLECEERLDVCVQEVADCIRGCSTDNKGRGRLCK